MNEHLDPSDENFTPEEFEVEKKLRPLSFDDFSGQDQVLENLKIFVQAANLRSEALDHTLFHGPPGLGKQLWHISWQTNWMLELKLHLDLFWINQGIWQGYSLICPNEMYCS